MPIRLIIRTDDASMAANVGGQVHSEFKTFDIDAPEVERFLAEITPQHRFVHRQVVGVEVAQPQPEDTPNA